LTDQDALDQLRQQGFADFCRRNGIALAMLFGSASRGGTGPESDIDLAVSLGESSPTAGAAGLTQARRRLIRDLCAYLHRSDVDLVLVNGADPLLRFEIAEGGKPLYEEKPGLFADFCSLAVRQHEDARVFYEATDRFLRQIAGKGGKEE
jgi:hypothetical protein